MNEQFRVIDLFQAYLPILMIVVLSVLLVYNLGYFYALDWHYLYLLRMADYYAGTLPLLAFILVLYSSLVYQALDVPYWPYQRLLEKLRRLGDEYDNLSEGMARAKETISGLWFSRLEKMSLRQQIWLTKGQNLLRSLRRKPGRKLSVDRLEKIAASEEAHYDKLLYQYELLKPRLKTDVKVLAIMAAKICGLSSLGALAVVRFLLAVFSSAIWNCLAGKTIIVFMGDGHNGITGARGNSSASFLSPPALVVGLCCGLDKFLLRHTWFSPGYNADGSKCYRYG